MNLRFIDWIWQVRGSIALAPQQTTEDAFDRLDPLFREYGTTWRRWGDTLTFEKKDQASQDKMSIFDHGSLRIEQAATGSVLRYRLVSRVLLFCFLAPLLFLGFAQLTIALNNHEKRVAEATGKSGKSADAKPKAEKAPPPLNAIDKFLGAPAPEKPKKGEAAGGRNRKPSPTPAYVLAAMFAVLYVVGRILEDRLIKSVFRRKLAGQQPSS